MYPSGYPVFFITRVYDTGEVFINEDLKIDAFFDRADGTITGSACDLDKLWLPPDIPLESLP